MKTSVLGNLKVPKRITITPEMPGGGRLEEIF